MIFYVLFSLLNLIKNCLIKLLTLSRYLINLMKMIKHLSVTFLPWISRKHCQSLISMVSTVIAQSICLNHFQYLTQFVQKSTKGLLKFCLYHRWWTKSNYLMTMLQTTWYRQPPKRSFQFTQVFNLYALSKYQHFLQVEIN